MADQPQMRDSDLVVTAERGAQLDDGLAVLDVGRDALGAAARGEWTEFGLNFALTGMDALGTVIDPFGALYTSGVAWAMEHVKPLRWALDVMAGDPTAIEAMSATWVNVADRLEQASGLYSGYVESDLVGCSGLAVAAYLGYANREAELLRRLDDMARRAGDAVRLAGAVVATVRQTVRDLVAEAVGKVLSAALRAVATLGAATPQVVADIAFTVARYAATIGDWLRRLVTSISRLSELLRSARRSFDELVAVLENVRRWAHESGVASSALFNDGLAGKPLISLISETLDEPADEA